MTTDLPRPGGATIVVRPPGPLDYYLVLPRTQDRVRPDALVVEEFVLAEDCSALGLDTACWSPGDGGWWSSAAFSRSMRAGPDLRARVVPVSRAEAALAFRRLGGGELPDEQTLRTHFRDRAPLATSAPLRLTAGPDDNRVYRILFANELSPDGLARLRNLWRMRSTDADRRVIGTGQLRVAEDVFRWDLRRVGPGVAWCLDVTANLGSRSGHAIEPLLRALTTAVRQQGLIPVTIERFS
jgi:hypothetical protein